MSTLGVGGAALARAVWNHFALPIARWWQTRRDRREQITHVRNYIREKKRLSS